MRSDPMPTLTAAGEVPEESGSNTGAVFVLIAFITFRAADRWGGEPQAGAQATTYEHGMPMLWNARGAGG